MVTLREGDAQRACSAALHAATAKTKNAVNTDLLSTLTARG
jgi:hypothetical protein